MARIAGVALLWACLQLASSLRLVFFLRDMEGKCFQDQIPKRVLTSMDVKSALPIEYSMFGPGRILHASGYGIVNKTFKFTTVSEGLFELCFTNTNREGSRVEFQFTVGQKAMDWSSITELDEVEQLQHQGNFALELAKEFQNEVDATIERFKERRNLQGEAGVGGFWLSVLFMLVFGLLMAGQYLAVSRHLSKRKFV